MDIKVVVALIGIGGVLSSALVQFWLGSRTEKEEKAYRNTEFSLSGFFKCCF
ncbi:hypothetical protein ACQEXU_21675 [Vibrio sp. TRT 21S02]|uniref:hypothetical protein n=1 Tax=Vibrio sp. TRT 21S02 TaxID=3418507 RepID=UPI003CF5860B